MYRVPYSPRGSDYGVRELEALRFLFHSQETLSCGKERSAFEREFAQYVGVAPERAVSMANCTVALEIATYLADLRPGDNVIVTPQSYQATLNPLLALDVEVRFADIDPETLCLSPSSIMPLLDDRTQAVLLTHYGGLMADIDQLHAVLSGRNILVIEDCAHSHGSSFKGRHAGASGNIACFSFQSMKNMSTLGEGGLMLLPNEAMAERVRALISIEPDATFEPRNPVGSLGPYSCGSPSVFTHDKNAFSHDCTAIRRHGTNSTLSEPAAVVGRVQLTRLPEFLAERRRIAGKLDSLLADIPGVRPQQTPEGHIHSHHLYTCFVEEGIDNQSVARAMVEAGVEIQQRYFPLHLLPEWRLRGGKPGLCPVTEKIWFKHQLNLPIYPSMTDEQIEYVALALRKAIHQ